jgi:hypothetical protein
MTSQFRNKGPKNIPFVKIIYSASHVKSIKINTKEVPHAWFNFGQNLLIFLSFLWLLPVSEIVAFFYPSLESFERPCRACKKLSSLFIATNME